MFAFVCCDARLARTGSPVGSCCVACQRPEVSTYFVDQATCFCVTKISITLSSRNLNLYVRRNDPQPFSDSDNSHYFECYVSYVSLKYHYISSKKMYGKSNASFSLFAWFDMIIVSSDT